MNWNYKKILVLSLVGVLFSCLPCHTMATDEKGESNDPSQKSFLAASRSYKGWNQWLQKSQTVSKQSRQTNTDVPPPSHRSWGQFSQDGFVSCASQLANMSQDFAIGFLATLVEPLITGAPNLKQTAQNTVQTIQKEGAVHLVKSLVKQISPREIFMFSGWIVCYVNGYADMDSLAFLAAPRPLPYTMPLITPERTVQEKAVPQIDPFRTIENGKKFQRSESTIVYLQKKDLPSNSTGKTFFELFFNKQLAGILGALYKETESTEEIELDISKFDKSDN